jgi:hypothetical protein
MDLAIIRLVTSFVKILSSGVLNDPDTIRGLHEEGKTPERLDGEDHQRSDGSPGRRAARV